MSTSPLLGRLIDALRCLPGVGPKSAQRMAFYLLDKQRDKGLQLAETLREAMTAIKHCHTCNNFSETEQCPLCSNPKRNQQLFCIVESPADVLAIEQTAHFRGRYFVLMGHLSPLDGIGPSELRIDLLTEQLEKHQASEVILATSTTAEGEATAYYIAELCQNRHIPVSRIAHGIPLGGELEYIDSSTLAHAFAGRQKLLAIN